MQPDGVPGVQPAEQFWKLYELFHIHDIEFDGVYLQGMLSQVPPLTAFYSCAAP